MKRILFDTNVVLDVLLERPPFAERSAAAWAVIERGEAQGFLSAHAVTTIHYLLRKQLGDRNAKGVLAAILTVFVVAAVDHRTVTEAFGLPMKDFEDAVAAGAARGAGCDLIVTRDPTGFAGSPVRFSAPDQLPAILSSAASQ
ncbi:MAG: PIN domain-containing protein [Acidobacteria bacterium]|nr:PIN domain-containing protein [Acidobacteriota bacterium]